VNPVTYLKHPKYDYVLTSDLERRLPWELGNHDFCDEKGRVWLQFRGRLAVVKKGYAWDGASCAPDFPDVIIPSCLHDALLQFADAPCFPLSKSQIDRAFLDEMPQRFVFRRIYWGAVRLFGGVYATFAGKNPPGKCLLPHDTTPGLR
jgi:hypothetical protein